MAEKIQSVKGMYDILPGESALWLKLEDIARRVLSQYGYRNIRTPIVEPTALFVRAVGEHTDIVEKEMFAWEDALNGHKLALRPEGTAGVVRAVIEHNMVYNGPVRLWYTGPMFRHENVQKGRQRQFTQIGVEAFGFDGPDVDAEQIILLARLWRELGLADVAALQINTIGDLDERAAYRQELISYFERHAELLDGDARRRLHANPLRILDSKNPAMQEMIDGAPRLLDQLGSDSRAHFDGLCRLLDDAGVAYQINTRLVRGLDYYNRSVFEWVTDRLGAQGTIAAGGRYDGLVAQMGGRPAPAVGFGLGMERVLLLMKELGVAASDELDAYLVYSGEAASRQAPRLAEALRDAGVRVILHSGGGKFANQMKRADAAGAAFAVILGDDEASQGSATLKPLRGQGEQRTLAQAELAAAILGR
ncbi:histidine--tRNA ligase [Chitinimonas lacunae]|uniref:Histidine--tRNA ligase n=1 Tax=Chitinimonas lacunae TaxID=1963018 RepID=A0ABV8MQ49_9NEIS